MNGIFKQDDSLYSIEYSSQQNKHYIDTWDHKENIIDCGSNATVQNITGRDVSVDELRNLYLPVAVVVDYGLYLAANKSENQIESAVVDIINMVSKLYKPLNVFVTLVELEIWHEKYMFEVPQTSRPLLRKFREYRQQVPSKQWHCHRNAVFMTNTAIMNDRRSYVRGTAYQDNTCENDYELAVSFISTYDLNRRGISEAMAHEIGHNLGMEHDTNICKCDSGTNTCLMKPREDGKWTENWSSCSLERLLYHQQLDKNKCLFEEYTGCTHKISTEIIIAIIAFILVALIAMAIFLFTLYVK
ncbi:disintegrin and metalloproteinase domain-containing protein 12-like protein [Leptotrombidium deliense]|uniref:Disintegrin and metalloproteinase domain-containing protein 12-like protein n=1 Tax=Leptotrombidium deliense TaxID=299467 RepID=A0A443S1K6_9ACAR|nr:disintegrin and metalloproteinase domain-containing protein 12-like protein [Leptotrombidium deliense]